MILEYTRNARDNLAHLPPAIARRASKKMQWFAEREHPLIFAVRLVGTSAETWRFRIGEYRALCRVKGDALQVLSIQHRKNVYREL